MPVSVIVGGQYGSEGKGKVALEIARKDPSVRLAVRPGGTNSGHTGFTLDGRRVVLRQLPAAAIHDNLDVVIPAGSYVDPNLLINEMGVIGLDPSRLRIDPRAHLISGDHVGWEDQAGLSGTIGSTGSGTGAAVLSRMARFAPGLPLGQPASECSLLRPYLADTVTIMRSALSQGARIIVEGTQGFGLSPFHGDSWPKATSRDTTAAAFLSESGLAPNDADDVVLVLRCWPIRVAGDSGPLVGETSWDEVARHSNGPWVAGELTSVTRKLRRVGKFDPEVVRRAIAINQPSRIVLNHMDQIDFAIHGASQLTARAREFVNQVEADIERKVDMVGTGEQTILSIRESV